MSGGVAACTAYLANVVDANNAQEWCPLPDSNRHAHRAQDFKSCMSTNSIKGAGALSLARIAPAAKFGIEGLNAAIARCSFGMALDAASTSVD